jgi:hypothetical protein
MFPELINGKVALIHRKVPNIELDFFQKIEHTRSSNSYWKECSKHIEANTIMNPLWRWERRCATTTINAPANDGSNLDARISPFAHLIIVIS